MLGAFHEASGGQLAIRLARQVSQSPGDIWPFVTGPAKLPSRLFPAQIDLTGSAGTDLSFVFPDGRAPNFTGQILTSNHPLLLECSWGAEVLRWDLAPIPQGGTDLLFTNIFPERDSAAPLAAGWHADLDVLEAHLAGLAVEWNVWGCAGALTAGYTEACTGITEHAEATRLQPAKWAFQCEV